MNSNTSTVTVWQSGRLAPQVRAPAFEFRREHWLGAGLLLLSAIVLALFVAVLERTVHRSDLAHEVQRERAVAEARCEAGQPATARSDCIVRFNRDVTALDGGATPGQDVVAVSLR
jgi:uncharacterized membrane protein YcjF (UPF0283 family)